MKKHVTYYEVHDTTNMKKGLSFKDGKYNNEADAITYLTTNTTIITGFILKVTKQITYDKE